MNYYFVYDQNGAINPCLQMDPPAGSYLGPYPEDTITPDLLMVDKFPKRYAVKNGQIVPYPYLTLDVQESTSTQGELTITATINNPSTTPPSTVTLNILGVQYQQPVVNNQAELTISYHASVKDAQIAINAIADGCSNAFLTYGMQVPQIGLQVCTQTGSTMPTIAPVGPGSIEFLGVYWTSTAVNQAFSQADIDTAIGLLKEAVFGILMPQALQQNPNLLDANQKNGLSDIQNNIIPSIPVTLESIAPVPASGAAQSFDQHYAHYKMVQQASKLAYQNYVHDQKTIPGLA